MTDSFDAAFAGVVPPLAQALAARGYSALTPVQLAVLGPNLSEADLLVWISSFDPAHTPPRRSVPTVVLGRAGMTFEPEPDVFIPVGTPGIDHAGHLFRTDRVVTLPLHPLRESVLPAVGQVLGAIESAL